MTDYINYIYLGLFGLVVGLALGRWRTVRFAPPKGPSKPNVFAAARIALRKGGGWQPKAERDLRRKRSGR